MFPHPSLDTSRFYYWVEENKESNVGLLNLVKGRHDIQHYTAWAYCGIVTLTSHSFHISLVLDSRTLEGCP